MGLIKKKSNLMATLRIEIVEAKLTRDTDTFGKMDPYCILKAGKQTHKTKVLDGAGKEPKWNEGFDVDAKKAGASIKIEVKDEDVTNSDDIGEANIKVAELSAEGGFDKWVDIKYKGKKAGQIHVVVKGEKKADKKKDGGSAAQAPEKKAPAKKKAEPKKKLKKHQKKESTIQIFMAMISQLVSKMSSSALTPPFSSREVVSKSLRKK